MAGEVFSSAKLYLIQYGPAVKKCITTRSHDEKRCEIKAGGQEMAVMVGIQKQKFW